MSGPREFIQEIIQTYLAEKLREAAELKVPSVDKPGFSYCVKGFAEGQIKIVGDISFAGTLIQPDFLKSETYLGDGVFDLRVDVGKACPCDTLKMVLQGMLDETEPTFEWDFKEGVNLVKIKVKVRIGPGAFHLRVYECENPHHASRAKNTRNELAALVIRPGTKLLVEGPAVLQVSEVDAPLEG